MSHYRTIVADPPWPYRSLNENSALPKTVKRDGSVARGVSDMGYGVMTMADLCALKPAAADDAHLYLWTTNAFMDEAHDLARAWGFAPKTILTWTKTHQNDPARVSMKTGYYFRGATEHCLFAVRGSLRLQTTEGLPTGYLWPRLPHSVKPDAFYDRDATGWWIESAVGAGRSASAANLTAKTAAPVPTQMSFAMNAPQSSASTRVKAASQGHSSLPSRSSR